MLVDLTSPFVEDYRNLRLGPLGVSSDIRGFDPRRYTNEIDLDTIRGTLDIDFYDLPNFSKSYYLDIWDIIEKYKVKLIFLDRWVRSPSMASRDMYGTKKLANLLMLVNNVMTSREFNYPAGVPIINAVSKEGIYLIKDVIDRNRKQEVGILRDYNDERHVISNLIPT